MKRFVKNVSIVSLGMLLGHVLSLISQPFITRLYNPQAYGQYALFTSCLALAVPIISLTYPYALFLSKKAIFPILAFNKMVQWIGRLTLVLLLFLPLVVVFDIGVSSNLLIFVLMAGSLLSIINFSCMNLIRQGNYLLRTKIHFLMIALIIIFKILFGLLSIEYLNLITAHVIALSVLFLIVLKLFRSEIKFYFDNYKKISRIGSNRRINDELIQFPKYRMPKALVNASIVAAPVFVLESCFGSETAGLYALAYAIVYAPMLFLGNSVYEVCLKTINSMSKSDFLTFKKFSLLGLIVVSMLSMTVLILLNSEIPLNIFSFTFGPNWAESGLFAIALIPWIFSGIAAKPMLAIVPTMSLEKFHFSLEVWFTVLKIVTIAVALLTELSALNVILALSLVTMLMNVCGCAAISFKCNKVRYV